MFINDREAVDIDIATTFSLNSNGVGFGVIVRRADTNSDTLYRTWVRTDRQLRITKIVDGQSTELGELDDILITEGVFYRMRLLVQTAGSETILKVKMWPVSDPEPAAWDIETTDNEPSLQNVAGRFGINFDPFVNRILLVDDFTATTLDGGNHITTF